MDSGFDFLLYQPKGLLAANIQGLWSASVSKQNPKAIKRWLHSDAGSGVLFNLTSDIYLDDKCFSPGVILQPVSKKAQSITLPIGAKVIGFRFHPAVSFGILGMLYDQHTALDTTISLPIPLDKIYKELHQIKGNTACITALYRWLKQNVDVSDTMPSALEQALNAVRSRKRPGELSNAVALSQRQIERQFQRWIGITPKHYQRILRVKKSLNALKADPKSDLVELALVQGFTDQAHMTREFKQIARLTPKQYCNLVIL